MALTPTVADEISRLWEQILCPLRDTIESQQAFDTWFRPIVPLRIESNLLEIEVPNPFFVDWIHEHYLPLLSRALIQVLGELPEIRLVAREAHDLQAVPRLTAPEPARSAEPARTAPRLDRAYLDSQLNPRLTFENFIVGSSSEFTNAACRAVAERPGHAYNPLFIFAGPGLGKTHLLHAVGHQMRLVRPEARVYYVTAERFTNEMIYSIQHAQTLAFRNKYRSVDLLLIDDIQFLAGKESTQEEFFHTFNALRDAHKQVVVTADKPPKDLPRLEERLTSRFNQGLVCDIKQPPLETRLAILKHRYEREGDGVMLPPEAFLLIADRIRTNIRDLEGCLVRVMALGSLLKQEVTLAMVEEVLQTYAGPESDRLSPERVVTAVAEAHGLRPELLTGRRRTQSIALPRQVAMYLLRQLTDLSLVEIGRFIGGRDHTTVMYACDRVAEKIGADSSFADKVNGVISTLSMG
jgi:chromosomal replication initiator protein